MRDFKFLEGKKINGYLFEKYLGRGAYGAVFKAKLKKETYAIKIFDMKEEGEQAERDMRDEIDAYRDISESPRCQQYIVCMYDDFYDSREEIGAIVLEFMGGGDLSGYLLKQPGKMAYASNLILAMRDLASGLAFIHSHGLAHRDIKPQNILVSDDGLLFKLADLGMMCGGELPICTAKGTIAYLSPELARRVFRSKGRFSVEIKVDQAQQGDIWALGLVFWQMAFGRRKFPFKLSILNQAKALFDLSNITQQDQVEIADYTKYSGNVSPEMVSRIINAMLQVDPKKRPQSSTIRDILDQEIVGCAVDINKNYNRREIKFLLQDNPEIKQFFDDHDYDPEMLMGDICDIFKKYLESQKEKFTCYIKGKKVSSTVLKKKIKESKASDLSLCSRLYKRLWEENKINKRQVAKDIYEGISLVVEGDIEAGITDEDVTKVASQIDSQHEMIENIVYIVQKGGKKAVDEGYLRERKRDLEKDLKSLQRKTKLSQEQKHRKIYDRRMIAYLKHTLKYLRNMLQ